MSANPPDDSLPFPEPMTQTAVRRQVEEPTVWTAQQVAAMFELSKEYVLRMAKTGEWPCWRRGRVVRFFPEHLEQIKALGSQPMAPAGLTRQPRRRAPVR